MIIARQHPGESVSSYIMEGVIKYLISDKKEAEILRQKYIFKIIPMVNPDGVIYGNFRCNLSGVDLNRKWFNTNRIIHPTPYAIKNILRAILNNGYEIDIFFDLHGHSKKQGAFMYCC